MVGSPFAKVWFFFGKPLFQGMVFATLPLGVCAVWDSTNVGTAQLLINQIYLVAVDVCLWVALSK